MGSNGFGLSLRVNEINAIPELIWGKECVGQLMMSVPHARVTLESIRNGIPAHCREGRDGRKFM
jgi:hypothetical protein